MGAMLPIAHGHGLSPLQLACQWNLAHEAVACCAPTLIQEAGPAARPIEDKRRDLAGTPREVLLTSKEVDAIRRFGDNRGSMTLKGAAPDHEGEERPDRWRLSDDLAAAGRRWGIDPVRDLTAA
jgi:hypothetical protein